MQTVISQESERFGFGRNWNQFLSESYDDERLEISRDHLLTFLGLDDLSGMTFLDIGSGSGLHSLAALRSGARRVISFDYDPHSVKTTSELRERVGSPEHWTVSQGSVLDAEFMNSLPPADIVYSWGVLHHTGAMWQAIENAVIPLTEQGVFYIALYAHEVYQNPSPEYWVSLKREYNQGSDEEKARLEDWYAWEHILKAEAAAGKNPLSVMREYKKSRGMEFWTDVRDWLGGYPIEFAKARDVAQFAAKTLGLSVLQVKTGEGNTEFLLRRTGASNYWDRMEQETELLPLEGRFAHKGGHSFRATLPPQFAAFADQTDTPRCSPLHLYEDGISIGFPHATHDSIHRLGEGRYSHWQKSLLFSTTDESNPNKNGRQYTIRVPRDWSR